MVKPFATSRMTRAKPLEPARRLCRCLRLSTPKPFQEIFRGRFRAPLLPAFRHFTLNDHLRRDAGVIHARLPQNRFATHPLEPAQNVLKGIVERMAHMQ
ncbi:MAG: hypothetical protein R3C40_03345 [Parvularculaceae bacterium]